jgi:hypothetical protein
MFFNNITTFEYTGLSTVQVFAFLHNKVYFLDELHKHRLLEHLSGIKKTGLLIRLSNHSCWSVSEVTEHLPLPFFDACSKTGLDITAQ